MTYLKGFANDGERNEAQMQLEVLYEKLMALLDYYSIDRNDPERWFTLCIKLAFNHVPGFQLDDPVTRRGPEESEATLTALGWLGFREAVMARGVSQSAVDVN